MTASAPTSTISPNTHDAHAKYTLYFSMHISGIRKATDDMASNVFDMKTAFIIAHSLLWLVSSSHNVLHDIIASNNIQLAIRKDEEFSIPYSITASSLNHRQSSKATAMWISCLYNSFFIVILCFYSRVERKPRNLICF